MRLIPIVFFIVLQGIHYQNSIAHFLDVNDSCTNEFGKAGICVHLEQCHSARESIQRRGKPKICHFTGIYPIVCCEKSENLVIRTNEYGQIANQKCEEYKITSVPTTTTTTTTTTAAPEEGSFGITAIGGEDAKPLEFPHMAILGHGTDETHWTCGGSLISENFVLTAAHCIDSRYGRVQKVNLGVHQLSHLTEQFLQSFGVKNVFVHPDYSFHQHYNDIALIELDGTVNIRTGVKPACLYTKKDIPTDSFVATGWGATELHGDYNDILQKVFLKFVSYSNCSQYYRSEKKLANGVDDKSQLCADGGGERADTCQGDSGGPLHMEELEDGLYSIIGITSFGIKCAIVPAIYTRVSNYIPWIENILWPN